MEEDHLCTGPSAYIHVTLPHDYTRREHTFPSLEIEHHPLLWAPLLSAPALELETAALSLDAQLVKATRGVRRRAIAVGPPTEDACGIDIVWVEVHDYGEHVLVEFAIGGVG